MSDSRTLSAMTYSLNTPALRQRVRESLMSVMTCWSRHLWVSWHAGGCRSHEWGLVLESRTSVASHHTHERFTNSLLQCWEVLWVSWLAGLHHWWVTTHEWFTNSLLQCWAVRWVSWLAGLHHWWVTTHEWIENETHRSSWLRSVDSQKFVTQVCITDESPLMSESRMRLTEVRDSGLYHLWLITYPALQQRVRESLMSVMCHKLHIFNTYASSLTYACHHIWVCICKYICIHIHVYIHI